MEETKKPYVCAICGAGYDSPLERAHCEITCEEKKAEALERERQAKLAHDMDRRKKEILVKFDELRELCLKFSEEYGTDVSVGLYCQDDADERSAYDVLKNVADLWGIMQEPERAMLAKTMAGTSFDRLRWRW